MKYYNDISKLVIARTIRNWVPHFLSREERDAFFAHTLEDIRIIRALESAKQSLVTDDIRIEDELFLTRLDYRVTFTRIFRINDLPDEIFANIVRYIVWSAPDPTQGVRWRLWLTWTCRHWRTVAIADPTLWNAIWFRDRPLYEQSFAWLDRSGDAPLDLRINDTTEQRFTPETLGLLLDKIFTKLSTIRMLIVIVEDWEPALLILDKLRVVAQEKVPMIMERLELHRSGLPYVQLGNGYDHYAHPIPLFGGAAIPTLNYFSINGIHVDWSNSILSNLTAIDMRRIPLDRAPSLDCFRAMLSNSPRLRKLILDGAGPSAPNENHYNSPVKLLALRSVVIAHFTCDYGRWVLAHIDAPHVRDFTLMNLSDDDRNSSIYRSLAGKFTELRLLTVWNVKRSDKPGTLQTMVKWLESIPQLEYLRIANASEAFMDLFLYDSQTLMHSSEQLPKSIICPKLTILDCQLVNADIIVKWGKERARIGAPLTTIYISKKMENTITNDQRLALAGVATVRVLEPGAKTPEEDELSK
ncbi:hypothetical protein BDQ12DRAFT_608988 [Crucibulum laeve]|uniref:Uncharacterized protein n=1 Tax=Crucibulum laeve TaxID=68775 RepID=A0A5C3LWQ9_9AGAR|nr:hypothetical protein BDQ12DRAFT_608988 [Crucibulum laeve]